MLVSVVNALTVEPDARVRAAIVAFFEEVQEQSFPPERLIPSLKALVRANRLAVLRTGSWRSNPENPPAELSAGGELDSQAKVLASLLRAGARGDVSGTYLRNVNLSGIDLQGSNFRGADLSHSAFRRSRLDAADFREARLSRTDFSYAILERANFSVPPLGDEYPRTNYILFDLQNTPDPTALPFESPNFHCAKLAGANFENLLVFVDVGEGYEDKKFFNFDGADLQDASFGTKPLLWRVAPKIENRAIAPGIHGGWTYDVAGKSMVDIGYIAPETKLSTKAPESDFASRSGFDALSVTTRLDEANWHNAALPVWMKQLLRSSATSPFFRPVDCGR
ncbi:pentapeptide repeat-containing protein (plasmid) [Ensifer sp. D2-11]